MQWVLKVFKKNMEVFQISYGVSLNNKVIHHHFKNQSEYLVEDERSKIISNDLKQRGFKFVGPVIIYAFMQAVGIYNDHSKQCFLEKVAINVS